MSNNKQSMKLYTEEQVRDLLRGVWTYTPTQIDNLMDVMTPIELPSSTDLEKKAFELHKNSLLEFNSYLDGGKFVIDKIQGGNNERRTL